MQKFECEFCLKNFSNKGNLNAHISKAKYCFVKRGQIESKIVQFKCKFCDKSFTSKSMLDTHESKCNAKNIIEVKDKLILEYKTSLLEKDRENESLKKEITKLELQNKNLQDSLTSIAIEGVRKSTTTNNCITSNNITQILTPFDLDNKDILRIVENLDETSFMNSQKGIAKFCVDNLFKTDNGKMRMVCSDPTRERFKYMDEKGDVKEDLQARYFIERIYPPIKDVGTKLHQTIKENCEDLKKKIDEGTETDRTHFEVKVKQEVADKAILDICNIKHQSLNGDFRKELAILTNV